MLTVRRFMIAACLVCLSTPSALAHGVHCFAKAQGARVYCRGWFAGGGKPKDCPVKVYLPDGTLLLEGRTDDQGEFAFDATVRADLKVVIEAGEGHQAAYTLAAEALPADLPAPAAADAQPAPADTPAATAPSKPESALPVDEARLRAVVREVVRDEVAPLRMDLEQARQSGPGVTEIVGGIGWILGLMGVALWARRRSGADRSAGPS